VTATAWYAGYGSNLSQARLRAYLAGGRAAGSRRAHPGARSASPPQAVATCTLPGPISFRGRFSGWGDGGGAAFWDGPDALGRTWCRAYLLRADQITDLALQENGLRPDDLDAAELATLDRRVAAHGRGDASRLGLLAPSHPYADAVRALARTDDGESLCVVTVTAPDGATPPRSDPPVAYVRVILQGLRRDVGLDDHAARAYLRDAGVSPSVLDDALSGPDG
jgi:hypothetical protein